VIRVTLEFSKIVVFIVFSVTCPWGLS